MVPTDFNVLVRHLVDDPILLADIQTLLLLKKSSGELQAAPRIESVNSFIESEMSRLSKVDRTKAQSLPIATLDAVFRKFLKECWD